MKYIRHRERMIYMSKMDWKKKPLEDKQIREEVDRFYREIVTGQREITGNADDLYASLGYDMEMVQSLPEDVRSGLSCGNPLEKLMLLPGETLLDLGSGAGMDIFMARMKFPDSGTLYGMDKLPEMVKKAERIRDKKGMENIEFVVGSLIDMPFEDEKINKMISNCVINLEPNKKKVYEEMYRVLVPGGMFFVSDITLKQDLTQGMRDSKDIYGT